MGRQRVAKLHWRSVIALVQHRCGQRESRAYDAPHCGEQFFLFTNFSFRQNISACLSLILTNPVNNAPIKISYIFEDLHLKRLVAFQGPAKSSESLSFISNLLT